MPKGRNKIITEEILKGVYRDVLNAVPVVKICDKYGISKYTYHKCFLKEMKIRKKKEIKKEKLKQKKHGIDQKNI